jgi:hypothetical protein
MRKFILLALSLTSLGALAAHGELRQAMVALRSLTEPLLGHGQAIAPRFDKFYTGMVEALPPQERSERALELAIDDYRGAADYVIEHAQGWRGQIHRDDRIDALIRTALNSRRIEIRMAAFEVGLAEFGLEKTPAEVQRMLALRAADPKQNGPWALWNLSLLGARGIERQQIFGVLSDAVHDGDAEQRKWAVDALARFGGEEVIPQLLERAAFDSSAEAQERAFCGLAQSGTLQLAERYHAVPGLLSIAENSHTSSQQHAWAYQALREITETYDVPEDAAAWRRVLERTGLLAP